MLELALGNLYPAPDIVEAVLAPKHQGVTILDLGAWMVIYFSPLIVFRRWFWHLVHRYGRKIPPRTSCWHRPRSQRVSSYTSKLQVRMVPLLKHFH